MDCRIGGEWTQTWMLTQMFTHVKVKTFKQIVLEYQYVIM